MIVIGLPHVVSNMKVLTMILLIIKQYTAVFKRQDFKQGDMNSHDEGPTNTQSMVIKKGHTGHTEMLSADDNETSLAEEDGKQIALLYETKIQMLTSL